MMNRSRIDWCDFSWNPITGCRHDCPYCYARKQARRFCGDIRLNKASPQLHGQGDMWVLEEPFRNVNDKVIPLPAGFEPTLHRYRMTMPRGKRLPANIFVGSMADVFGTWVPDEWIEAVFLACEAAPWHNYIFLTKNPARYKTMTGFSPGWWFGTSATKQDDFDRYGRAHELHIAKMEHKFNAFLSIEPMHEALTETALFNLDCYDWVIVGAETGGRAGKIIA